VCVCVYVRQYVLFDVLWPLSTVPSVKNNGMHNSCNFALSAYSICSIMSRGSSVGVVLTILAYGPGLKCRSVTFAAYLHLLPRWRMSGSITVLLLYAFMSWRGSTLSFQGRSQNCAKRLLASCLSVRPQGATRLRLDGFL
jgi:hypothetical protein